jgi:hypothetical protein
MRDLISAVDPARPIRLFLTGSPQPRFGLAEQYGIAGAAGAIENVVQRTGGSLRAESTVDYGGRVARAREFEAERTSWYHSVRGVAEFIDAANRTIGAFGALGDQIQQQHPTLALSVSRGGNACSITNRSYTVAVGYNQGEIVNSLRGSYLFAKLFRGHARPEQIDLVRYDPDIDRTLVAGWRDRASKKFLTATQMAEIWLRRFLDLIQPTASTPPARC